MLLCQSLRAPSTVATRHARSPNMGDDDVKDLKTWVYTILTAGLYLLLRDNSAQDVLLTRRAIVLLNPRTFTRERWAELVEKSGSCSEFIDGRMVSVKDLMSKLRYVDGEKKLFVKEDEEYLLTRDPVATLFFTAKSVKVLNDFRDVIAGCIVTELEVPIVKFGWDALPITELTICENCGPIRPYDVSSDWNGDEWLLECDECGGDVTKYSAATKKQQERMLKFAAESAAA